MCSVRSNSPRRGYALKDLKTAVILKCLKSAKIGSKLAKICSNNAAI